MKKKTYIKEEKKSPTEVTLVTWCEKKLEEGVSFYRKKWMDKESLKNKDEESFKKLDIKKI